MIKNSNGPISPKWDYKPGYYAERTLTRITNEKDCIALVRDHPSFALHSINWRYGEDILREFVKTPVGANQMAEICLLRPDLLRDHVGMWGELVELTRSVGKNIRPALLAAARLDGSFDTGGRELIPFCLRLPDEAAMLPLIVGSFPGLDFLEARKNSLSLGEVVELFVPDLSDLTMLAEDESQLSGIRGAAAMMALLHPKIQSEQRTMFIEIILNQYEPRKNHWYLRSAGIALDNGIVTDDQQAVEAMGTLLRAGMGDFPARFELNHVMERWRQKSKAPVHARGRQYFQQ